MATLDQLTHVRSQLALGLQAYLKSFVDLSAWGSASVSFLVLPDNTTPETAVLELYQQPDVVNLRELDPDKDRHRRELDRLGLFGRGPDAPRAQPWLQERDAPGYLVVLGRPGDGKTLLTRLTCRDIAGDSLTILESRRRDLSEIPIPIWIRFDDILKAAQAEHGPEEDPDPIQ